MLAVKPDCQNNGSLRTDWLDPILKPSADWVEWVQQLQRYLFNNVDPGGKAFLIQCRRALDINEWLL
jgi:hypothetical protein